MIGVCIPYTNSGHEQNNWDYLLSNFQVDEVFILGKEGDELPATNVYGKGTFITSVSQLPESHTLIVLAPQGGTYIKGDENLITFTHPQENVIYMVGSNHRIISEDDFEGKNIDHKVYIPNDTNDEMFNWVAMAINLYDRKVKNG